MVYKLVAREGSDGVRRSILDNVQRWMSDYHVDGLRLDAVPYLIEREGTSNENNPETHAVVKKIRAALDAQYTGKLLLAEANMWPEEVRQYFGDGDECHMAYHFPMMPRLYMSIAMEDRHPLVEIMGQTPEIPANCQWAIFLRNHDELTLEMVTDEERDYLLTFASQYFAKPVTKDDVVWTYSGVRPLYNDGAKSATAAVIWSITPCIRSRTRRLERRRRPRPGLCHSSGWCLRCWYFQPAYGMCSR